MEFIGILPPGANRVSGRAAIYQNIAACLSLVEVLRTSFGPHSLSKLLVGTAFR